MRCTAAGVVAALVATTAVAGAGGSATAAERPHRTSRPESVAIGSPRLAAPGATAARARPALLVPVRYPLHMKARAAAVRIELIGPGRRVVARSGTEVPLAAGLERGGVDRRSGFTYVHTVALPARQAAGLMASDGRLTVRVRASAVLDADGDRRAEARSADVAVARVRAGSGGRLLCGTPPLTYAKRGASATQQLPRCSAPVSWSLARGPQQGAFRRTGDSVSYRAGSRARGWDGLLLRARPLRGGRASAAAATTVPLVVQVGSGAASTVRVRAVGDSITAGFGWYADGGQMSAFELPWCRPSTPLNDACSSNSLATSTSQPLRYAADYGLSNGIAWPAQWAWRYGITDYANYAVTGSAPSDWLPGGPFYAQLRTAEAAAPDYLVFTLGANPLLSDVLFGIDNMYCTFWTGVSPEFNRCVLDAFARVNLAGNLRTLYSHMLAYTPARTTIIAMQYYSSIPVSALTYTAPQLERMAELLDGVIQQQVAAAGSPRLRTLSPPRFNVGIDMSSVFPSNYRCDGGLVDGPSAQSTISQDEMQYDDPFRSFCRSVPWIISADSGIHPNRAGHAQIASVLPVP